MLNNKSSFAPASSVRSSYNSNLPFQINADLRDETPEHYLKPPQQQSAEVIIAKPEARSVS